ncbi:MULTISPECIES: response regulator transcription factor [Microbacterium]|uniref:response regulator transcription factor n=1 Tax=Microbacterium TaxID=33882 RepID=UPI000E772FFA|nr:MULTISPECIES: response regulator transcription factor [Microbacterium]RKE63496.1 DNA-binding response OmpR family regulator [Microbacterium sp. AG238]WJM16869.1 response regulator transcription factor [Microbacterium arborescens]
MERTAVIVEDQADIRSLLSAILESSGFVVHATDNGLDGVELVRSVSPDVTTLDVNIPGIDGFEVARRVREFSDTYIIFISAFVEPGDAERGRAAGGDEYLGKPFRPRDLKARLAAIPSRRRRDEAPIDDVVADAAAGASQDSSFGDVSVVAGVFRVSGAPLDLSPPESTVLHDLLIAHGRTRTKNELAVALRSRSRGDAPDADEVRAVERTVESLRGRLATAAATTLIVSDQGIGYRLDRG